MAVKGHPPLREPIQIGDSITRPWAMWFDSITFTLRDDKYLVNNVYGKAGEVTVIDNGDGSITLSFASNIFSSNIFPIQNETIVTTNPDNSVNIGVSSSFLSTHVSGEENNVDIIDNADGTIQVKIADACFFSNIYGAADNISIISNGDGTITLSLTNTVKVKEGLIINSSASSRPAAEEAVRGMMWITKNAAGVADTVEVCLKSNADTYSWVTIATG